MENRAHRAAFPATARGITDSRDSASEKSVSSGSRRSAIPMMQAPEMRLGNDAAVRRRFDLARDGRVAGQRLVRTRLMIISKKAFEGSVQMPLAENDYVIEALATKGADEPLDIGILPRRARRDQDFLDTTKLSAIRCQFIFPRRCGVGRAGGRSTTVPTPAPSALSTPPSRRAGDLIAKIESAPK
jgi:hypothetical protein